ncbi:MAG: phosphoglycerate dehydrogenase [Pseudomonadota bacterium]|nr:phosphoglycerate dehydrogenase [Pseudomonadota bacterium]HJO34678.1 phosphoglycerate dehydrogenase [Gammaproteobacteria bacterium]
MFRIQTLNNISPKGLALLPPTQYEYGADVATPDAVLLRSHNMHEMDLPASVQAVGRAGAGVNNIPVPRLTELGVPVFNTPGANANAVKELVIAGMLLAARNLPQALQFVAGLEGQGDALNKVVEAGKKRFVGHELPGRTLAVIGLGAIGVKVANAAVGLGMQVIGYDPKITVSRAWQLSAEVDQAASLEQALGQADFISLHVPLLDSTRNLLDATRLGQLKPGAVLLNFAREGIVDPALVMTALEQGQLQRYVTDFPTRELIDHDGVIALPHLGASTTEAEENCAMMVARQVRDYLENGNITNSVNFPETVLPRTAGHRVSIINANIPNMLGQISSALADSGLNILDMLNKSRGEIAYTLVDVDQALTEATCERLRGIDGVLRVRTL